jgi:hypothetical protein
VSWFRLLNMTFLLHQMMPAPGCVLPLATSSTYCCP